MSKEEYARAWMQIQKLFVPRKLSKEELAELDAVIKEIEDKEAEEAAKAEDTKT